MKKIELVPQTIVACCVLHNICLIFDDSRWMETLLINEQSNLGDETTNNQNLFIENTLSGCMKRDQIMIALNEVL